MQLAWNWACLLAAWRTNWRDPFNGVYFRSNTKEVWAIFIVMGMAVACVLLWQLVASRTYGRLPSKSPRGLFRELCRAHGLDMSERRLLKQLATARDVSPPVHIFVQPEHFSTFDLPDELSGYADEIARIERRLFGESTSPACKRYSSNSRDGI